MNCNYIKPIIQLLNIFQTPLSPSNLTIYFNSEISVIFASDLPEDLLYVI